MEIRAHDFQPSDLVGGHVVLDFVNTVTARNAQPGDWLDSYRRALEWAALTEHFDRRVLAQLRRLDRANPAAGEHSLQRLRDLRETIYAAFVAIIGNAPSRRATSTRLETFWKEAAAAATLAFSGRRLRLELSPRLSRLDYLTHELALQAVELLQDVPITRTRLCPGCGWLFIDSSRGGQRRWCDMATCGNAAKSRRHYARIRAANRRKN